MIRSLVSFRKQLPLPMRMGYGWIRRKLAPCTIWDNEDFRRYFDWLRETEWWSREELEALQVDRLKALVKHAYENVPYYRRVFEERQLRPGDISNLEDLQKLPLLSKEDVRNNLEDLVARNVDRANLHYLTTSGSTGIPLGLYHEKDTSSVNEDAFRFRQWSSAGYRFGDRYVTLRANLLISRLSRKRLWWDFNTENNELVLSSMDMTEESMDKYVRAIRLFGPKYIHGLPSSLEILARFMKRHGVGGLGLSAIFCESETLYAGQRRLIESQFGGEILGGYGLSERVADATECDRHSGYHVSMEYGILELVDGGGNAVTEPGALGRVVGTGFDTYCMPLIRYATDDLATFASRPCSCNRQSALIGNFVGRIGEFVISRSGRMIPYCVLEEGHSAIWAKMRELKFYQEREGELSIHIVKAPAFAEEEIEREFLEELRKRLDEDEFGIEIEFVNKIPRKGGGKLGSLEQRLSIEFEDLDRAGVRMGMT